MQRKKFIGIDIGGTKIAAAIVNAQGKITARGKIATPVAATPLKIFRATVQLLQKILKEARLSHRQIAGIGIGIPGIVATDNATILATPNIRLAGFPLVREMKKIFPVPVAVNNDVNLGLLGEHWLGAGRQTKNLIGLFPGTGIGGGIILNGKLFTGANGAAAEIGHMIVHPDGPLCSCGNRGCLEAFSSRWAIERDIRLGVKQRRASIITKLTEGNLAKIKSKTLKKALTKKDPLTTETVRRAAVILGQSCISLKHIFNPEMIILGGGLIEACGDFVLPIVQKTVRGDPFFTPRIDSCTIVPSQLGDDAVILGAVALVRSVR